MMKLLVLTALLAVVSLTAATSRQTGYVRLMRTLKSKSTSPAVESEIRTHLTRLLHEEREKAIEKQNAKLREENTIHHPYEKYVRELKKYNMDLGYQMDAELKRHVRDLENRDIIDDCKNTCDTSGDIPKCYKCSDGSGCYPATYKCDGVNDCKNKEDEEYGTTCSCRAGTIKCPGQNRCATRCNYMPECADRSDEKNCPCPADESLWCKDKKWCVSNADKCNTLNDCEDKSDEDPEYAGCAVPDPDAVCDSWQWHCPGTTNECIPQQWECDDYPDCGGHQDEDDHCKDNEAGGDNDIAGGNKRGLSHSKEELLNLLLKMMKKSHN